MYVCLLFTSEAITMTSKYPLFYRSAGRKWNALDVVPDHENLAFFRFIFFLLFPLSAAWIKKNKKNNGEFKLKHISYNIHVWYRVLFCCIISDTTNMLGLCCQFIFHNLFYKEEIISTARDIYFFIVCCRLFYWSHNYAFGFMQGKF